MKLLEQTCQNAVKEFVPPAPGLADHSLTEECRQFPYRIALLCLAGDAGVAFASQLAAFWMRFHTPLREFVVDTRGIILGDYLSYIIFGSASLVLLFAQKNTYDAGWLLQGHSRLKHVVTPCLLWGAGFLGFSLVFKFQPPISRGYVALATTTAIAGLYTWRRCLYSYLRREFIVHKHRHRILAVGWTAYAERLREIIENDASHPYDVVCCVSVPDGDFQKEPPDDLQHVGRYSDIQEFIKTLAIDIVLIVDANVGVKHLDSLASLCEMELVQFRVVPSYFSILISGLYLETLNGIPILGVSRLPLDRLFNRVVKRLFDIIGAMVGLLLSAPLIAVFGTLVYLESPGPILYRQRRSGRNGKTFQMLKIRSMRLDAEQDGKAGWSTKDDPRRLRIGKFMRKWNIDETPQFWNVLKGEMSLVGPRPERPELIRNFKQAIPHYNARYTVKPGITGSQIAREVAKQTNQVGGDGTTTAIVLANALIRAGLSVLNGDSNPIAVMDGIDQAVEATLARLKELSRPVTGEQLLSVAINAANDRAIGAVVTEALHKVGSDGMVEIEPSLSAKTAVEIVDGFSFGRGYSRRTWPTKSSGWRRY